MTESRSAAISVLSAVLLHGKRPKPAIDRFAAALERRDRAFVMEIVYGVLRQLYLLDHLISGFVRDIRPLNSSTLNNLRIALYQLLFMRVPSFAVVNEAVEREKACGKPSLVNGVLRNFLRTRANLGLPIRFNDPIRELSINTSHPEWLLRRWADRFGMSETQAIAQADNSQPMLTIRVNTLRTTRDDFIAGLLGAGIPAEKTRHSPDGIAIGPGYSFPDLADFSGLFSVQDEAAQLVSYLVAPQPGERILDACAAPGGKSTHMAQLMGDHGEIVAVDRDAERLERVRQNTSALGIRCVRILHQDLLSMRRKEAYDRVLLDAPCSAMGVVRRNPDIKYRTLKKDLPLLARQQREFLSAAAAFVPPKGRLVYAVCSFDPAEGEDVVHSFLKTSREFRIIEPEHACVSGFMRDGFFRTFPHIHMMDGFFGVILCRKA